MTDILTGSKYNFMCYFLESTLEKMLLLSLGKVSFLWTERILKWISQESWNESHLLKWTGILLLQIKIDETEGNLQGSYKIVNEFKLCNVSMMHEFCQKFKGFYIKNIGVLW